MRLISGEKYWKHVSLQKVVTLNTCCDVACLTFKLLHIIGADSTGATGNFAPVLTQEPGKTLRFAPVPFMEPVL